jgi:hypothetical protein
MTAVVCCWSCWPAKALLSCVRSLLSVHVLIGTVLVSPVLLKIGSTGYRFGRYYLGSPAYRRKGPPPPVLRLLGPLVVASTLCVLGTGIALMFVGTALRQGVLLLHRASFVVWFAVMVFHVLGPLLETARLAPRDWLTKSHADIAGGATTPVGCSRKHRRRRAAGLAPYGPRRILVRLGTHTAPAPADVLPGCPRLSSLLQV